MTRDESLKYRWDVDFLLTLLDQSVEAILVIDRNGIVQFANSAAAEAFAGKTSNLIGYHFGVPVTDNPEELELPCGDGTLHLEMFASEIHWKGEKLYLAELRDISERKRAEGLLRESEQRYRRLFEDAVLGIFQSTVDGKVIEVNSAFARMFGYASPDELKRLVKNANTDLFADPSRRAEIILQAGLVPDLKTFENRYKRKDGSVFTGRLHLRAVRDSEGKLLHFGGLIEDISEKKISEDLLRRSEERFSKVFSSSPVGIAITTTDEGKFIDVNAAFLNIYGYTRDEIIGRSSLELGMWLNPDDRFRMAQQVREKGSAREFEVKIRIKSGDERN